MQFSFSTPPSQTTPFPHKTRGNGVRAQAVTDYGDDVSPEVEADYHTFDLPQGTHWRDVTTKTANLGASINKALGQIEQANPDSLAGIFGDAAWGNKERLPESALVNLINAFNGMTLNPDEVSHDLLGGEPGKGFYQMMDGVEVGRVNVAARACGLAMRAFELGIEYAQMRTTFGKPIIEHQAVSFRLADMATKVEAAHQMMIMAARLKDSGERNDLESGMAKYLASEYCKEVVEDSFRIHGGYGYSKEYEIERLYREAPMLMIGEGTADIQKMIIGRRLLEDYKIKK